MTDASRPSRQPLFDLLEALLEERAKPEQIEQLQRLLASSPEARRAYVEYLDLHASLPLYRQLAEPAAEPLPWAAPASPWRRALAALNTPGVFSLVFATAALFAGLTLLAVLQRPAALARQEVESPEGAPPAGAAASSPAVLDEPRRFMAATGEQLRTVRLGAGARELRFSHGARVVAAAAARVEPRSGRLALLHQGELLATVPPAAHGFVVETPLVRVIDLGTRFAVRVEANGATEIEVLEGKVRVEPRAAIADWEPLELLAGQGRRIFRADEQLLVRRLETQEVELDLAAIAEGRWFSLPADRHDTTVLSHWASPPQYTELRIGGRTEKPESRAAVIPFYLPALLAHHRVAEARLEFVVTLRDETAPLNFSVDLYGLPCRGEPQLAGWLHHYAGPFDRHPGSTALAAAVLRPDSPLGRYEVDDPRLADYLNAQLQSGAAGQYIFLRLNPREQILEDAAFHIASADALPAEKRPVLHMRLAPVSAASAQTDE